MVRTRSSLMMIRGMDAAAFGLMIRELCVCVWVFVNCVCFQSLPSRDAPSRRIYEPFYAFK